MASLSGPVRVAFDTLHGLRSCDVPITGLNHTPQPSDWSVLSFRALMDISAPAISLAPRPRTGHLGYQDSQAPGGTAIIPPRQLADVGPENREVKDIVPGSDEEQLAQVLNGARA